MASFHCFVVVVERRLVSDLFLVLLLMHAIQFHNAGHSVAKVIVHADGVRHRLRLMPYMRFTVFARRISHHTTKGEVRTKTV